MISQRFKWAIALIAVLLTAVSVWLYFSRTAGSPDTQATETTQPREQKTIVISVNDMKNPISEELTLLIAQLVTDNENLQVEVLDAQGLQTRQAEQLEKLDGSAVSGVVILPVTRSDQLDQAINHLNQVDVPAIILNQPASDSEAPGMIHIGFDALEAGRQQAQFCIQQLNGQGQIVILAGPEDHEVTRQMLKGVQEILDQYEDIVIADIEFGDWSRKSGLISMIRILQDHPTIDAVLAQTDEMLVGALSRMNEQNIQCVKIGLGATTEGLRLLSQDYIDATVSIGSRQLADAAFNQLMTAIKGDPAANELLQPQIISKTNLDTYIREIWNIK